MYTVSITRLRIRTLRYLPLFALHAFRSGWQAREADGMVDFSTRAEDAYTHWTKTVWRNDAAMKQFRNHGAHQRAMRLLAEICSEAAYVRWEQQFPTVPTWEEAHEALLAQGKLSKLKHPSAAHLAGQTAPALSK
jgi:hypothetical protein